MTETLRLIEPRRIRPGLRRRRGLIPTTATVVEVPKEVKNNERRVGMKPDGVTELVHCGHEVVVEARALPGAGLFKGRLTLRSSLVSRLVAEAHNLPHEPAEKFLDRQRLA